jgi:hypothetical protein
MVARGCKDDLPYYEDDWLICDGRCQCLCD